ncbi:MULTISPECIES: RodZ family helix-turn-helix domain-containing protein [Asticcacaulis]|uniref:helix-turn-helix domain-containing protein n=1 Tax=Asticcacaulis TaxID=76890 RepID=UPI001AE56AC0|nr:MULTISPECIES: helix-turn-helix transcriptional regulator [Asticcacaulis]MBP2159494.1 transcriptional regulator with XRE-family HTH domain [Asticcacaulis solisilvae]MDR6800679.1 transcriptional regulator with XRE-family HTH domain [Asticcacaulis sp. BE141]
MSNDTINVIEDEPYEGLYRGAVSTYSYARDHLPDRFDLADILRSTREARGWSLELVSEMTRVRQSYLEALEQAAYDVLPPRAFAIGYVKAYAKALGLDEETLADMFKRDVTDVNTRLQAPSGASLEDVKPNYRLYLTTAVCLVAAVVVWNIFQRKPIDFSKHNEAVFANQAWSMGVPMIRDGVVYVTKSQPAPQDQDVPPPYATPGLEEGFASMMAARNQASAAPVPVQDVLQARKAFNPRGAIYGAQPDNSAVTIQAKKSVLLVVHDGKNGVVHFVQQLGAGESYRVPLNDLQTALVDVTDVSAIEVYHNGEYAGMMDANVMPVAKLNARAAQMAAQLDAQSVTQGQVSTVYRTAAPAPQKPVAAPRNTAPIPYAPSRPAAPPPASVPETPPAAAEGAQ